MSQYDQFLAHYETYKDKLYSYFFYRLSDQALCEDLVSDVWLKAYEKFETYDDTYAFSTWIYTIAKNTLVNHFRAHKPTDNLAEANDISDHDEEDIIEQLSHDMSIDSIKQVITQLPDKQQDVILMKYMSDMSTSDIATVLDTSPANIRQLHKRGLNYLQANIPHFSLLAFTVICTDALRCVSTMT